MNKVCIKNLALVLTVMFAHLFSNTLNAQTMDKDVMIIELVQTAGEFNTSELHLKPGRYQFRVVNKDVDKDLGFVIQKESHKNSDVMETAISNSFTTSSVKKGEAQYTGVVVLQNGNYVYSCPLNPTPHYKLLVK